jgi:hypothetical protein
MKGYNMGLEERNFLQSIEESCIQTIEVEKENFINGEYDYLLTDIGINDEIVNRIWDDCLIANNPMLPGQRYQSFAWAHEFEISFEVNKFSEEEVKLIKDNFVTHGNEAVIYVIYYHPTIVYFVFSEN